MDKTLYINYAVNDRSGKCHLGGIEIFGTWTNDKTRARICKLILGRHPGHLIQGYSLVNHNEWNGRKQNHG